MGPEPIVRWCATDAGLCDTPLGRALAADAEPVTRERLARLRRADDRAAVLVAHTMARRVAAEWFAVSPSAVSIRRRCAGCGGRDHGRPEAVADDGRRCRISLSHTRTLAVVAVGGDHRVGIDAESSSIDVAWAREARDVFDPDEVRRIAAHDSGLLGRTFWTRKEALVKLHGVGLTASLARIRVGDVPPHGGVVSGAAPGWVRDLGGALGLDTHAVALACDEPPETIDLARLEPRQLTRDRADQDSISNSTRSRISP